MSGKVLYVMRGSSRESDPTADDKSLHPSLFAEVNMRVRLTFAMRDGDGVLSD